MPFKNLVLPQPLLARHAVALFEIAAGTEDFIACACEHDATYVAGIFRQSRPQIEEIESHSRVESVRRLRPVQRDHEQMWFHNLSHKRFVRRQAHNLLFHFLQTLVGVFAEFWRPAAQRGT